MADKLGGALAGQVLEEEVSGNELLEAFYREPTQYALPLQVRFLVSRFSQLRVDCWPREGTVITDYVFDKDALFAELNLKKQELQTYRGLWELLKDRVRRPDVVINLQAEPAFLLERIRQRDRAFERGMKLEYLERLTAGYEKMLGNYEACPVIRIDSASEPACNEQSWKHLLKEVIAVVPQLSEKISNMKNKSAK